MAVLCAVIVRLPGAPCASPADTHLCPQLTGDAERLCAELASLVDQQSKFLHGGENARMLRWRSLGRGEQGSEFVHVCASAWESA